MVFKFEKRGSPCNAPALPKGSIPNFFNGIWVFYYKFFQYYAVVNKTSGEFVSSLQESELFQVHSLTQNDRSLRKRLT